MAMISSRAEAPSEQLKKEIKSTATVSKSTLKVLRALLGVDLLHNGKDTGCLAKKATASNPMKRPVPDSLKQKPRRPNARGGPDFTIYEPPKPSLFLLAEDAKRRLATETFNTTLKHLSDAAKASVPGKDAANLMRGTNKSPQKPLQDYSPNREPQPGVAGKSRQTAQYSTADTGKNLESIADCACVAVDYLLRLVAANGNAESEKIDWRLERGALILLDKLTSLKMRTHSLEEISTMRLHFEKRFKISKSKDRLSNTHVDNEAGPGIRLPLALEIPMDFRDKATFSLATSFQSQILRVALLYGRSIITDELLSILQPRQEAGPCGIILQGVRDGLITEEQAAQQLRTLSQALMTLCATSGDEDAVAPSRVFKLRCTALEVRYHSWKLLSQDNETQHEIWQHFGRALARYRDESRISEKEDYKLVKHALSSMQEVVGVDDVKRYLPQNVRTLLSDMAHSAGLVSDSLAMLESQNSIGDSETGLSSILRHFKIATLRLGSFKEDRETSLSIAERAFDLLKGTLRGTTAEMNDLLLSGARLRKACLTVINDVEEMINTERVTQVDISLQICALRIVYAYLSFVVRYSNSVSGMDKEFSKTPKGLEQTEALAQVGYRTLDAVMNSVKCGSAWMAVLLAETDTALMKCGAMATFLERQTSIPPQFLRISNCYWSQYLRTKTASTSNSDHCLMLGRATEILSERPPAEQENGLLALKYSKLSSAYLEKRLFANAKDAQMSAIRILIKIGALVEAVELALSGPWQRAWSDHTSKSGMLGKALASLQHLTSLRKETTGQDQLIYDDSSLPATHRAVLLEKQVLLYADVAQGFPREEIILASKKVLDLYDAPTFQVCRLRFAQSLLIVSSKNGNLPAAGILGDKLDVLVETDENTKLFLHSYGEILRTCVRIHWLLQINHADRHLLEASLTKLVDCLKNCIDKMSLEASVDSPANLSHLLRSVVDYAGMMDFKSVKMIALCALFQVLKLCNEDDSTELILCLSDMGALQTQMGDTVDAGRSFATAEKYLSRPGVSYFARIQWELAYADYLIEIPNTEKCSEMLLSAGAKYDVDRHQAQSSPARSRVKQNAILAHGAFVASKLAFMRDDLEGALLYARQCIKLTTATWMALEKMWDTCEDDRSSRDKEDSLQNLADGVSELNLSIDRSGNQSLLKGAPFWEHVNAHFNALLHLSSLCAHSGLYQDAIYYVEQAHKVGISTSSSVLIARAQSVICLLYSRGSSLEQATSSLATLDTQVSSAAEDLELCYLRSNQTASYLAIGDIKMAQQCLARAEHSLNIFMQTRVAKVAEEPPQESRLANSMARLKIASSKKSRLPGKPRTQPTSRTARTTKSVKPQAPKETSPVEESRQNTAIRQLSADISLLKAQIAHQTGDLITAASQLTPFGTKWVRQNTQRQLIDASVMIAQALEALSADAVHGVLAETTIALPSKYGETSPADLNKDDRLHTIFKFPVNGRKVPPEALSKKMEDSLKMESQELLSKASIVLRNAANANLSGVPSEVVHRTHRIFSQLTLMTSVISVDTFCSPISCESHLLAPKDFMRQRETWVVNSEIKTTEGSQIRRWPILSSREPDETSRALTATSNSAEADIFGSLPASWTVVSLCLSGEKSDLIISRRSANSHPFVLRIPLLRTNSDELEDVFSFHDARNELTDIISQANLTAHDARGHGDKAARKVWWSERQELDRRLEALLKNIESMWLGGFRGIMNKSQADRDLLGRFANSLSLSLAKHLPSRQKSGSTEKLAVQLHAHVIELFVALGHPDEEDLDDLIADLLYFVVDILQFSGERNAYDEIDFDIIVVEVLDALRSYHETFSPVSNPEQHTILILDNELHAFPWESLPCLIGQSVSRIPSLAELRGRIQSTEIQTEDAQSLVISPAVGSYILNPSSDLISTQETFQPVFEDQLPGFEAILNRVPSEKEFESCLRDNSLFLYFGHGSGAQYIRARTIKKSENCAVTFLMGCSSSKMVECGVYEPYGVPCNYMFAGAPALVGTLWDVTDKDIDRFAMTTFINWGLVDSDRIAEERKGKEKVGKAKKVAKRQGKKPLAEVRTGKMTLDEAVAKARESCVLRYLNGAAPVIYGVPVSLGEKA